MRKIKGFTLIELLIVVAIIAILALIAVPNFLEAQVRSKVSRAKSEMRSLATALEAYYVDNNAYVTGYGHPVPPYGYGLFLLSSPIAYMSQGMLKDPFYRRAGSGSSGAWLDLYIYRGHVSNFYEDGDNTNPIGRYGKVVGWTMWSRGPDKQSGIGLVYPGPGNIATYEYIDGIIKSPSPTGDPNKMVDSVYDPSNGTISGGNIYRVGGMLNEALIAIQRKD